VPEILEVEMYRRAAATIVGRRLLSVDTKDSIVVQDAGLIQSLVGALVTGVSRHGKLLTIHSDMGSLDLHFGMAGRIIVDGRSPIDELVYGASSNDRWIRFGIEFDDGFLAITDPRRFARVAMSQKASTLGPDAFSEGLFEMVQTRLPSKGSIKGVLLNQNVIAGLGNMLVDEILSRSAIDPRRDISSLSGVKIRKIFGAIDVSLPELLERGGSHMGDLAAELRIPGSRCPYDGQELARGTIAGRTTYWCPRHQK
jgi:formamidopyrimidine-DNA glycosylase